VKYPRTPHLPTSPGATDDDVRVGSVSVFDGLEVVVTEKLDGENTTIGPGWTHARSLESSPHPSRSWVRALAAGLASTLPPDLRLCGENLFARHSIGYHDLPGYFLVFGVWEGRVGERCLSWDETVEWAALLDLPTVPVLYRGVWPGEGELVQRWRQSHDEATSEGFVVRTAASFAREEFTRRVAKWVRAGHVQTGRHWMTGAVVPNGLAPG
jgi:hypothetical protein